MIEMNFDDLSEEELKFFQEKYIDMFTRIKDEIDVKKANIEKQLSGQKNIGINDLKLSPFGKLALIAKKIFVNSALSKATGIDPVFLNNDTSFLRKTESEKLQYYRGCDPKQLSYTVVKEHSEAFQSLINMLKSNDYQELMTCMKNINHEYNVMYDLKFPTPHPNYEALWHKTFKDLNIFKNDEDLRWRALLYNGIGFYLTINPIDELNQIYNEYNNNYGGKHK